MIQSITMAVVIVVPMNRTSLTTLALNGPFVLDGFNQYKKRPPTSSSVHHEPCLVGCAVVASYGGPLAFARSRVNSRW